MSSDNILKDLLKNSGNFLDDFINIILVFHEGRNSFLFETANHSETHTPMQSMKIIEDFISELSNIFGIKTIIIQKDKLSIKNYPRFFISLKKINLPINHEEVGKQLGFYCYDHNFGNYYEDRINGMINVRFEKNIKEQIYAEVCEIRKLNKEKFEKYLKEKTLKWNKIMKNLDLDIEFELEISLNIGLENLKHAVQQQNIKYIMNHHEKFHEYFENFGSNDIVQYYINLIEKDTLQKNFRIFQNLFFICYPDQERGSVYENYFLNLNVDKKLIQYLNKVDYHSNIDALIDLDNIMKKLKIV